VTQDESHVRLLSIFHYILAAPAALFSSLFLMHFFLGAAMLGGLFNSTGKDAPPPAVGILFMAIGGAIVLIGWAFAGCLVAAGWSLASRKRYTFCLVVAGLECVLCNPLGTVLGVFSIVVLLRPSVKALFGVA
jgi:hypothetical protein